MTRLRARGEAVRQFILENLANHPQDICKLGMVHFGISRQAMNRHIRNMIAEKCTRLPRLNLAA
jgi:predicted transcriptional regulator